MQLKRLENGTLKHYSPNIKNFTKINVMLEKTERSDMRPQSYINIKPKSQRKRQRNFGMEYFSCSGTSSVPIRLRLSLLGTTTYRRGHKNSNAKKRQKDVTLQFPFKIEIPHPLQLYQRPQIPGRNLWRN